MPEAAECRLTAEYLNKKLQNRIIYDWVFIGGQYEEKDPSGFEEFHHALPLLVIEVGCKGKLIYFVLHNELGDFYVLHSLRMTGRWQEMKDEYCRWYLDLDGGEKLWFRNPRCLATLQFTSEEYVFDGLLKKLGPDILGPDFTLQVWRNLTKRHRNKNVTSFLMNQNILSGCGNYIKAEALYYAEISPLRKVGSLSEAESEKLFEGLRIIPRMSYNYRGLSLRDYANQYGKKGAYEFKLKIYGHNNAKRTKTADGRTTYWDPEVQK